MDPSLKDGKDTLNKKVKHREPYRPFGASVLREYSDKLFDFKYDSPYMLYVCDFLDKEYPAVSHVDHTCRIQTVERSKAFESFYDLIEAFRKKPGLPMVLNTSLNGNGKPIAGHIEDANTLFKKSEMDALVVGDELVEK